MIYFLDILDTNTFVIKEKIEDTKEVIKEGQTMQMAKRKGTKRQTIIYKTLLVKLQIEQHKPHKKTGWTQVLQKCKLLLLH